MEPLSKPGFGRTFLGFRFYRVFRIFTCDNGFWKMGRKKYRELSADERMKADIRTKTNQRVRRGKIDKLCCRRCGANATEKHHTDYEDPNMILWLCGRCHKDIHKVYEQYHAILPKFKAHLELSFVMGERLI